jgi:hypothetical protein
MLFAVVVYAIESGCEHSSDQQRTNANEAQKDRELGESVTAIGSNVKYAFDEIHGETSCKNQSSLIVNLVNR